MSLPLLHAGKSAPGLSAALDLRFALDKSLTAYRGPTPSFSRASTGSYFDGSGVLRYATVNTILYSEDFSNAYWTKSNGTISTNQAISPDGKNTADLLYPSSTGAARGIYAGSPSATTISVYAKSSGKNWIALTDFSAATSAWFNLSNGTVGTVGAGYTAAIQNAGNGWYRCSLTKTTGFSYFQIYGTDSDNTFTATVNGTDGVFIWGAQGELSSTVGTYCPTTSSANSAPRFNHTFNGTSWVSRGLLVEEQRTNVIQHSNDLNNAAWNSIRNVTITSNAAISPEGVSNANQLMETTASGTHGAIQISAKTSATYTLSVFVKPNGRDRVYLDLNIGSTDYIGYFDLTSKTYLGNGGYSSVDSYSIGDVGNGWLRLSITKNSALDNYGIFLGNGTSVSYAGDSSKGVYVYGFQLESGAFPTSYIPTTSAATTRSADVCQITGGDFSSIWNGTEGAIAYEADSFSSDIANQVVFQASDGTLNNQLQSARSQNNAYTDVGFWVKTGNVWQSLITTSSGAWNQNLPNKNAMAYKINDFAFSNAGSTVLTDTSGTIPTVDRINIGASVTSAGSLNGHIARLRYYRKRLPNETLQLLSEPDPTLNLQFALNKSLTPVAGPAPSFSRASTGTYFNASGVLTSASINTPRFDHVYSGGQWVSRGLLIEEQRTNLAQRSEDFGNAYYSKSDSSISANQIAAPDGATTADKLVENTANAIHYFSSSGYMTTNQTYACSIFAKAAERNWIKVYIWNGSTSLGAWFNLSSGTIGTTESGITSSIQNVGNGWYRCSITRAVSSGLPENGFGVILATADNSATYTGDGSSGVYVWGSQVEAGSFSTSYIGTTTSSVTRSADVCQITGTSFSWMWNQGEGSVVAEYDRLAIKSVEQQVFNASTSGGGQQINYSLHPSDDYALFWTGSIQAKLQAGAAIQAGIVGKNAIAYKVNDFAMSFNGGAIVSDNAGTVPIPDRIGVGSDLSVGSYYINGHIAKLIYYPARLTNTKLQQLST